MAAADALVVVRAGDPFDHELIRSHALRVFETPNQLWGPNIRIALRIDPSMLVTQSTVGGLTMKVIVTGGAGFIGANLCRSLSMEPSVETVVVIDDLSTGRRENLEGLDRIELVVGFDSRSELLAQQFDGTDAVVHFAARRLCLDHLPIRWQPTR